MTEIKIPKGFETIDTKLLKENPKNVKIHTNEQVKAIAEAIKLLGIFKDPLVIDKKNVVHIGNGRLKSALLLEMPKVPIIHLDHLSKKDIKALMIIDNKINESAWNNENLNMALLELKNYDWSKFDMDFEAFEMADFKPTEQTDTELTEQERFNIAFSFENNSDYEFVLQRLKELDPNKELALLKLAGKAIED